MVIKYGDTKKYVKIWGQKIWGHIPYFQNGTVKNMGYVPLINIIL